MNLKQILKHCCYDVVKTEQNSIIKHSALSNTIKVYEQNQLFRKEMKQSVTEPHFQGSKIVK